VISMLVGVGKLLLGSPLFGLVLLLVAAGALVLTVRRISQDCAGDVDQSDFLEEIKPHD
jgi:hypothetical protein